MNGDNTIMKTHQTKKHTNYLPMFCGIISSIIFGFSFFFTKIALNEIGNKPLELMSFRFGFAAIFLTLLRISGIIKINLKNKKMNLLIILSIFYPILYFIFEALGVQMTSSSEAGTMVALLPIVVAILASIFLKEKTTFLQIVCILGSICGVIFINIMNYENNGNLLGILVLSIAVFSAAIYNILSRKLSAKFTPIEITYVMMWIAAFVFNTISIAQHIINHNFYDYLKPLTNCKFLISILYLSILSSVIAFIMLNYMFSKLEASKVASYTNLSTIVSIFAGVIILKEPFQWYKFIGIILILFGVWGTNKFGISKENYIESINDFH